MCPSSVSVASDRTEKPVGKSNVDPFSFGVRNAYSAHNQPPAITQAEKWSIERRNPLEKALELLRSEKAPVHRLGLCLMNEDKWSSQHAARKFLITNSKQLEQNKVVKFYKKNNGFSKRKFREVHQQNLNEMEELRKFQSSTFDTHAKLIVDQNTIEELSGRLQELQNEVNCMNDSQDYQDAESVRSGNSHVTSQPMSFPTHPIPEGMLRPSFVSPRRKEGPLSIWGYTWYIGKRYCKSTCFLYSSLSSRIESMEEIIEEPIHMSTAEKSERPEHNQDPRCRSGPSAKDSVIFSGGDSSKNYGADQQRLQISISTLTSSPRQQPSHAGRWGSRPRYVLVHNFLRRRCNGSRKWSWLIQWMNWDLRHLLVVFQYRILKYLMRGLLQRWTESSIIPSSKGESVWRNKKAEKEDRFLRGRQIAYLIYDHFWVTGSHDSVENYTDLFTVVLRNDDIQEFDSKWDGILLSMTKIPLITAWIVQNKNTRVWKTQDRIGIVWPGDSSEEVRTDWKLWWREVSSKKFEIRILGTELENLRRTPWSRIREQNSVYKEFLEIVGKWKPTGSVWKETLAVSATIWISVEKVHQIRLRILSCGRVSENHRGPEVPEVKALAVECHDGLARITLEELAITHIVGNRSLLCARRGVKRALIQSELFTVMEHNWVEWVCCLREPCGRAQSHRWWPQVVAEGQSGHWRRETGRRDRETLFPPRVV